MIIIMLWDKSWTLLSFTATQNLSFTFSRPAERETNEVIHSAGRHFPESLPWGYKSHTHGNEIRQKHLMIEDTHHKKTDASWCCMKSFKRRTIGPESEWKRGKCEISYVVWFTPEVVFELWLKQIIIVFGKIHYLCRCSNFSWHESGFVSFTHTNNVSTGCRLLVFHDIIFYQCVYPPVNFSTVASVHIATTVPSGMFILLHQYPCDLLWHQHVTGLVPGS